MKNAFAGLLYPLVWNFNHVSLLLWLWFCLDLTYPQLFRKEDIPGWYPETWTTLLPDKSSIHPQFLGKKALHRRSIGTNLCSYFLKPPYLRMRHLSPSLFFKVCSCGSVDAGRFCSFQSFLASHTVFKASRYSMHAKFASYPRNQLQLGIIG